MAGEKKILVIEDDPTNAHILSEFFEAYGYQTVVARDGLQGQQLFWTELPDLVIIDILLPYRHGYDVYRAIRSSEHGRRTPIFLMSAVFNNITSLHDLLAPTDRAQAYFTKPFDLNELIENVQFFCG